MQRERTKGIIQKNGSQTRLNYDKSVLTLEEFRSTMSHTKRKKVPGNVRWFNMSRYTNRRRNSSFFFILAPVYLELCENGHNCCPTLHK